MTDANVVHLPHDPRAHARAVGRRLRYPSNGRVSEESEVAAEPIMRRRRIESIRQREREEAERACIARQQAIDAALRAAEAKRQIAEAQCALITNDRAIPLVPRISAIMAEVSRRYSITPVDLISSRRTYDVVMPRQITMYLARHVTTLSLPQIGQRMGGRDHTTVMHAVNKIKGLVESHPHLAAEIEDIKRSLGVCV